MSIASAKLYYSSLVIDLLIGDLSFILKKNRAQPNTRYVYDGYEYPGISFQPMQDLHISIQRNQ